MCRTIPKLFFRVAAFMACSDNYDMFRNIYGIMLGKRTEDGKLILHKKWFLWSGIDHINSRMALVTSQMTKGMTNDLCTAYFYHLKPLHCIGSIVRRRECQLYWRRLMPPNLRIIGD